LALDRGEWSASHPGHFTPKERAPVPIAYKAGWAPEPLWTWWRRQKFPAPTGNQTPEPQSSSPEPATTLTELPQLLFTEVVKLHLLD